MDQLKLNGAGVVEAGKSRGIGAKLKPQPRDKR